MNPLTAVIGLLFCWRGHAWVSHYAKTGPAVRRCATCGKREVQ